MNALSAAQKKTLPLPLALSPAARPWRLRSALLSGLALLGLMGRVEATTYTLPSGSTAGWDTATWSPAGFPNLAGDIAQYNTAATAASTALDLAGGGAITLGQLLNLNTGNWSITTGTASGMVFDNTSGVGSALISTTSSGTLTVAPAITIQNTNLVVNAGTAGAITISGAIGGTGDLSLTGARAATVITLGDVNNTGAVSVAVSTTGFTGTNFSIASLGAGVTSLTVGDSANPTFGGRLNITGTSAFTGPIVIQGAATLATSTAGLNGSSITSGITFGTGGGTLLSVGGISTGKAIVLNGAGNFTTSSGNDITLSGAITGTSGLTKRGNGNLILSGSSSNTYVGDTFVTGGAVTTGHLSLQKTGGAIAVPGDLVLEGTPGNAAAIGSAANTVRNQFGQQFGASTVIRFTNTTSANHAYLSLYGNDQTVAGISESVVSGGLIQNSQLEAFAIDSVLTINNSADFFYTGFLRNASGTGTGTLGITKTGAGKQTLAGVQITYTGATTINQGILELQGTTGFNSAVTFGSGSTGILQFASATHSIRGLATTDAVNANAFVQNVAGTNTVLTVNQDADTSFGGTLRDNLGGNTLALTKTGTGVLTLAGTNTYTGNTAINSGVLAAGSSGALGTTGIISFGGGTLRFTAANTTDYSSRFATTANQTFRIDTNGQTVTFAGSLTSTGGSLIKSGTGTLILSGANAYTLDTTINEGVLQLGANGAIANTRILFFASTAPAGTTLRLNGFSTSVGNGSNSGLSSTSANAVIENGSNTTASTFTLLSGSTNSFAGILQDGGTQVLNFTRGGGNTVFTLTGASTYTGVTTLNSGTVEVTVLGDGGAASGIGAATAAASNLVLDGGGLSYAGVAAVSTNREFTLGAGGGSLASNAASPAHTLTFSSTADISFLDTTARTLTLRGENTGNNTFNGRVVDNGGATSLAKLDAGTWVLTAAHTYTGATTIGGGRLVLSGSLGGTAVAVNAGILSGTGTIGLVGGTTGVTLAGGGTPGTRGVIDLVNGTTGTLTLQSAASTDLLTLGGSTGNSSGLAFEIGSAGASDQVVLSGGKLVVNAGGARIDLTGLSGFGTGTYDLITFGAGQASGLNNLYLGTTAGGGFSYSLVQGATAVQLAVSNTFASSTWNTNAAGNWFTAGNWTGSVVPNGTGATAVLGNIITAPRIVTVDATATVGTLTFSSAVAYTVAASNGSTLVLNNNGNGAALNVTSGSHTISAPLALAEDTTLQLDGTQLTVSGVLSGPGRLTKQGAGTLVLTGNNTFSGGLSFTGGTLNINADLNFGAVPDSFTAGSLVFDGATLQSSSVLLHANRGVTVGAGGLTVKVTATMFVNSIITGPGQITVGSGGGQYVPGGASTYAGGTVFEAGSSTVPIGNSTGPADAPTSGPFGTGTLTFNGGRMRATSGASVTLANTVIMAADTTFYSSGAGVPNDKDLIFTGSMTLTGGTRTIQVDTAQPTGTTGVWFLGAIGDGGNNYGLIKTGTSALVLGGANTFTGGVVIRSGTIIAQGNAAALGGSGTGLVTLGHTSGTASASLLGGDGTVFANAITVAAGSSGTATIGNHLNAAAVFSGAVTLNKALTLASTGTGSVTLSGAITGSSLITVTGSSGNFVQTSGNNAGFTGDVAVTSGTLRLNSTTALNVANAVAVGSGGTFDVNARSVTIEGLNNGTGAGTVTNGGAAAVLTLGGAGSYSFGGALGATTPANLSLVKTGTGTQTLSGLSTYTGSTTVSGGTLALDLGTNPTGVLAAASTLTLGGGTLSVQGASSGGSSQALGNLTLTAGTSSSIVINNNGGTSTNLTLGSTWTVGAGARLFVDLSSGSVTLTSNPSAQLANGLLNFVVVKDATATGFGTISGAQIVRATTAELRNNSNDGAVNFITQVGHTDYVGTTLTMLAGTHLLNSLTINTDPGAGTLVLAGTSLTFNNNTLLITGVNNFAINGGTLGASATAMGLHHIGTGTLTISSTISGGAGSLTKTGTGTVALTGTNAYTGGTTINEGTLSVSGGTALADAGAVTLANNATAVFQVNASETIGTLNGGGALGGNVVLSAGTLTSSFTGGPATFNGIISGAGAFSKAGTGTLVLGGANTYAGLTTVDGILRITHGSALGNTGSVTQTTVASGGRVELSGGITVINEDITITGAGNNNQGGLHASSGVNEWAGQVILGSSPSRVGASGGATLVISGKITDGVNSFNFAVRTADSPTFSNVVELTNAANDYGGSTDVVVGVLRIAGGNNRLPTGTVLIIGNGSNVDRARFDLNGFNQQIAGLSHAGNTMLKNVHSATAATLTINNTSNYSFDGSITGAVSLVKSGAGVQTLTLTNLANGASSHTGTTTINGGILRAGAAGALSANSAVTLADTAGATLDLAGFAQTIASLAGGGVTGGNVTLGSATLTTGGNNTSTAYDGVISGAGGLIKQGSGAFKLTRANTYGGATTVNAGALIVNGSTGTGAMNVSGVLGGTGTVGGATTILTGGSLNPGDPDANGGIGKLTLSQGVTLNTGSNSTLEIRGATHTTNDNFGNNAIGSAGYITYVKTNGVGQGDHDQVSVTGTFVQQTDAGIDVVGVTGFTAAYGQIFNLLDWTTVAGTSFSGNLGLSGRDGSGDAALDLDLPNLSGTGLVWDTSFFASDGILVVVPEPGRMMLLMVGMVFAATRRRKN